MLSVRILFSLTFINITLHKVSLGQKHPVASEEEPKTKEEEVKKAVPVFVCYISFFLIHYADRWYYYSQFWIYEREKHRQGFRNTC
jgi:hypothetical protein